MIGKKSFINVDPSVNINFQTVIFLYVMATSHILLQVELVVKRENVQQNQIITIFFTLILALALTLMGLDLEIQVVITTLKVGCLSLFALYLDTFFRNLLDLPSGCFASLY